MPKPTFFNLPEDKRRTIIDLAIDEFADNSYENASISRVVARAGIAKGSLYQYFADKKDLYIYLLDVAAQEKLTFLQNIQPPDPQMSIFAYLRWMVSANTHFELSHPRLGQVVYRALLGDLPFHDETIARMKAGAMEYFKPLVQQGIADGHIVPDIDPEVATFVFNSIFTELGKFISQRAGIQLVTPDDGHAALHTTIAEQTFDQVIRILEHGMGTKQL
ncbi:MAG: DNA-binding transcriptional regulator, AcrR family [Chloroflexi bacterium AL-W]|nr:DNA-binding transcriptional regulator, AcrR family [Chloroflexi bacterium AL-N1]NOK66905.1 DNA-binding transcriptional regulator, AcrR family [Chloroflexi bacterium AL-N10]NOK74803.1 DNA-binding transcriptional regulator, AcrR family [Chloroflexi bacterium AL-N5]NOK81507.1 DNA-binding transcriptional regulator, AcrR family [Chloroflexi bacterium AL-W]NOK88977.1 DNA-binding transcriptional regulator, AcrR family [Chloroflexi bacterium AL-N15]